MREITVEKIIGILNSQIENASITPEQINEDLTTLGMDSIDFIRVVVSLEKEFDCEIPDSKLLSFEMNTVAKIFKVLNSIKI